MPAAGECCPHTGLATLRSGRTTPLCPRRRRLQREPASWQEHAVNVEVTAKTGEAYREVEQRADRGERTSPRLSAYELAIERVLRSDAPARVRQLLTDVSGSTLVQSRRDAAGRVG
jgi:hypothetical protein